MLFQHAIVKSDLIGFTGFSLYIIIFYSFKETAWQRTKRDKLWKLEITVQLHRESLANGLLRCKYTVNRITTLFYEHKNSRTRVQFTLQWVKHLIYITLIAHAIQLITNYIYELSGWCYWEDDNIIFYCI